MSSGSDEPLDLLVDSGELVDLGAGAALGGDVGDRSFHAAKDGKEVADVRAAVDRHAVSDLRDDLDQASLDSRRSVSMAGCFDTPNSVLSASTGSRSPAWNSPSRRRSLSRSP